jgi:hypothetical protein
MMHAGDEFRPCLQHYAEQTVQKWSADSVIDRRKSGLEEISLFVPGMVSILVWEPNYLCA